MSCCLARRVLIRVPIQEGACDPVVARAEHSARRGVDSMAQHRHDQDLQEEVRTAFVSALERRAGRNCSSRAVARNGDAARVHAQSGAASRDPPHDRERVVHGRGKRVLRRETVVDYLNGSALSDCPASLSLADERDDLSDLLERFPPGRFPALQRAIEAAPQTGRDGEFDGLEIVLAGIRRLAEASP